MSAPLASSGLFHPSQPASQGDFRAATAKHAKMAGVTFATFVCSSCDKPKPVAGRRMVTVGNPRDGYVCTDCQTITMINYKGVEKPDQDYSLSLRDKLAVLIKTRAMTINQIAAKTGRAQCTVVSVVRRLKKAKKIHIASWRGDRNRPGPKEALYLWGPGEDAEKPKPETYAEKMARRRRQKAVFDSRRPVKLDPLMQALFGAR